MSNLKIAARRILWGRTSNAGQVGSLILDHLQPLIRSAILVLCRPGLCPHPKRGRGCFYSRAQRCVCKLHAVLHNTDFQVCPATRNSTRMAHPKLGPSLASRITGLLTGSRSFWITPRALSSSAGKPTVKRNTSLLRSLGTLALMIP